MRKQLEVIELKLCNKNYVIFLDGVPLTWIGLSNLFSSEAHILVKTSLHHQSLCLVGLKGKLLLLA